MMDNAPVEGTDLLPSHGSENSKGNVGESRGPPDGGVRAYSVLVGSFLTNGLLFGVINSYSVIYGPLVCRLKQEQTQSAEVLATLVGTLSIGTTFMLSPLSGVLTGFLGLRLTAVLGGTIATAGLLLSSFVVDYVQVLCITYGVLYGLGASLAYTPSLAILGHYFKKRLGIVNGIVTIGSSVFTVFMPTFMEYLIKNYSLEVMFRILSIFTICIALCGLLFKPIPLMVIDKPLKKGSNFKSILKLVANVQLWKNKKYRLWALSIPIALFGYFVPYVHIKEFIKLNFVNTNNTNVTDIMLSAVNSTTNTINGKLPLECMDTNTTINDNLPLQCLAVTSALGRLSFGFLADRPGIDRILMQQISFYIIGTLTIILPFVGSFWMLVVIALGIGLFEGGFIALIGPIAVELCGGAYAAQAIGWMLGLASIPLTVGPTVAGALFKHYQSYTVPFVLAGVSPLIGATLMFTIRFYGNNKPSEANSNGHIISLAMADAEKSPSLANGHGLGHSNGDIHTVS